MLGAVGLVSNRAVLHRAKADFRCGQMFAAGWAPEHSVFEQHTHTGGVLVLVFISRVTRVVVGVALRHCGFTVPQPTVGDRGRSGASGMIANVYTAKHISIIERAADAYIHHLKVIEADASTALLGAAQR